MLLKLSNAPVNFQGYIIKNLTKKFNIIVIVYLDNIFIYPKDPGQAHINAICLVLNK